MSVLSSEENAPECSVPAVINAGHALEKSTPRCNDIQPTGRSVCVRVQCTTNYSSLITGEKAVQSKSQNKHSFTVHVKRYLLLQSA